MTTQRCGAFTRCDEDGEDGLVGYPLGVFHIAMENGPRIWMIYLSKDAVSFFSMDS